jgi:hypothetical protein
MHPSATYTVSAYIEYDGSLYPLSGNPFTSSATVGSNSATLTFTGIPIPNPPPDNPYRLIFKVDRNPSMFWTAQTQYGSSYWLNDWEFSPWSPNPIGFIHLVNVKV